MRKKLDPNAPLKCPHCGVSLLGKKMSKKDRDHRSDGATYWKREIGIYSYTRDSVVSWECPDCKQQWPR